MNDLIITPKNLTVVPDWEEAKHYIIPVIDRIPESTGYVPAVRTYDTLSTKITEQLRLCIAYIYNGIIIPLSEYLLKKWSVTVAAVQLAIEDNLSRVLPMLQLIEHNKDGFVYYTLNHPIPVFNSILPFYKTFQYGIHKNFGETYYMAVPERTTSVIFDNSQVSRYPEVLRNDVLMTYDCSTKALSSELIEVSSAGVIPILD